MFIHDPGNTQPIPELYAFMSIDKEGNEGICGAPIPGLGMTALVFGHLSTAEALMPLVRQIVAKTGTQVNLVKFTNRETLKTIGGENEADNQARHSHRRAEEEPADPHR